MRVRRYFIIFSSAKHQVEIKICLQEFSRHFPPVFPLLRCAGPLYPLHGAGTMVWLRNNLKIRSFRINIRISWLKGHTILFTFILSGGRDKRDDDMVVYSIIKRKTMRRVGDEFRSFARIFIRFKSPIASTCSRSDVLCLCLCVYFNCKGCLFADCTGVWRRAEQWGNALEEIFMLKNYDYLTTKISNKQDKMVWKFVVIIPLVFLLILLLYIYGCMNKHFFVLCPLGGSKTDMSADMEERTLALTLYLFPTLV